MNQFAVADQKQSDSDRLSVLDQQIKAKEIVLERLVDKAFLISKDIADQESTHAKKMAEHAKQIKAAELDLKRLENKRLELDNVNQELAENLKKVRSEIHERKQYFNSQEETINTVISEWNQQVSLIRGEAAAAQSDKLNCLNDIVRHEQERDNLADNIALLQEKEAQLSLTYEEKAADYRDRLRKLAADEKSKKILLDELSTKLEAKERFLLSKEKELKIAQVVQRQTATELEQKERKLKFDYNLAGEVYE